MDEVKKIICPYCVHPTPLTYRPDAHCAGVLIRCKGRHCKRIFEIKLSENESK